MACISFWLSKPVEHADITGMSPFIGLSTCKLQTKYQGEMCNVLRLALHTQMYSSDKVKILK